MADGGSTNGVHWELPNGTWLTEPIINHRLIAEFTASRRSGLSQRTIESYLATLQRFQGCSINRQELNGRLNAMSCGNAKLHHWRNLKCFIRWLVAEGKLSADVTPSRPHISSKLLPAISKEQLSTLISHCRDDKDKAIVLLLWESGLRISELAKIKANDIDWERKQIRVVIKGNREAQAIFQSSAYLATWFGLHDTWEYSSSGIRTMLARLQKATGIHCNPHSFRRGFCIALLRQGLSTRIVQSLGRWESIGMVERYSKSLSFADAVELYRNNH